MKTSAKEKALTKTLAARPLRNVPLHVRVRESLRELALRDFEDGERFFSEPELIQRLGVSQGTIRRALVDLAREGLLIRKVPAGTFVRKQPEKRLTIGIFTPAYDSPFIAGLLDQISHQCFARHFTTEVYLTHRGEAVEEALRLVENPPAHERVVLLCNPPRTTRQLHAALEKRGFRNVNVDTLVPGYSGLHVGVDNTAGIRLGIEHLAGLGHRRIALLVDEPMEAGSTEARVRAFEALVATRRLTEAQVVDCGTKLWDDPNVAAYRAMDAVLNMNPRPTAVFAVSDAGAWAVLKRLAERGIKVPHEISVLGFDDDRPSRFMYPALSSIAQPVTDIARRAVELLEERTAEVKTEFLPPTLVARESTGAAP